METNRVELPKVMESTDKAPRAIKARTSGRFHSVANPTIYKLQQLRSPAHSSAARVSLFLFFSSCSEPASIEVCCNLWIVLELPLQKLSSPSFRCENLFLKVPAGCKIQQQAMARRLSEKSGTSEALRFWLQLSEQPKWAFYSMYVNLNQSWRTPH